MREGLHDDAEDDDDDNFDDNHDEEYRYVNESDDNHNADNADQTNILIQICNFQA